MSYLHFYHLKKEPFNVTPDPEFLFLSPSHKEALGVFIYGITKRKGIVAVVGEVGVGKTTVLRSYLEGVNPENLKTVYLFNANVSFPDLMRTLCEELNVTPKNDNVFDLVTQVHHALIEEYRKGRNVVLIVDEAQNMPVDTLENLRMLSNLETSKDKLIQIALIGQPELEEKLNRHELRQLKQRIAVRATIRPLTPEESMDYIQHRLAKCRMKTEPIFAVSAIKEIIKEARGIPRLMNILCDNALITGFGYQQRPVGSKIVREVIADFKGEKQERPAFRWAVASAAVLAMIAIVVWAFAFRAGSVEETVAAPTRVSPPPVQQKQALPSQPVAKKVETPAPEIRKPQLAANTAAVPQPPVEAPKPIEQPVATPKETAVPDKKAEEKVVAQKTEPAPAAREQRQPKSATAAASNRSVTKAAETLGKKTASKPVPTKSQTSKYARYTPKKRPDTTRHTYTKQSPGPDSQKSVTAPATTQQADTYDSAKSSATSASDEPKEVPSELIEPEETSATNDSTRAGENIAAASELAEEGTQGAGSTGQNLVEPVQQEPLQQPSYTPQDSGTTDNSRTDGSEQVDLSSEVLAPKVIRASKPVYPYSAQLRRIEGTVIVSVLVSPAGDVEAVRILRSAGSNYGLDQAAVAAVKRWKFSPGVKNGKRVRVWVSCPIVFKLR